MVGTLVSPGADVARVRKGTDKKETEGARWRRAQWVRQAGRQAGCPGKAEAAHMALPTWPSVCLSASSACNQTPVLTSVASIDATRRVPADDDDDH